MLDQQTADKIYNRMIGLDRTPQSIYLEIEPAQVRIILNSLVSEGETNEPRHHISYRRNNERKTGV